jgi:thioredoxin 1
LNRRESAPVYSIGTPAIGRAPVHPLDFAARFSDPPFREDPMSDHVIHATDADFDSQVLQSSEPVLVDFWAQWCGPCKMIAPALDELADTYAGRAKVVKVDIDKNQAVALKYHVRSIPMLLLFKDGQVQATQIGAVGKAQLAQIIDKAL